MNNPWLEQQQKMFKLWSESMSNGFPGMDAYQNIYKNMMPNVADYWTKMGQALPFKNMFGALPSMESWTQMWTGKIPGMDAYTKLFDMWKGLEDPIAFLQNYQFSDIRYERCHLVTEDINQVFLLAWAHYYATKTYRRLPSSFRLCHSTPVQLWDLSYFYRC